MKHIERPEADGSRIIYALRHLESGEFICLRHEGNEYLACSTDNNTAHEFRAELGLIEHVDVTAMTLDEAPFDHLWLDGEMVAQFQRVPEQAARS